MADDVEMTPITEAEGGALPPKVSPFGAAPAPKPGPVPLAAVKPASPAVPVAKATPVAAAVPVVKATPVAAAVPVVKATPVADAPAVAPSAQTTIKLKPIIRKPMIRKPVIGGAKPATPVAVATPSATEAKKSTQGLKSITGPIPAVATLRKTGIIAEGIITPAQQQAAKSKTARISLDSAIGVAPVKEGPAPLKTIRLRRPGDLKPAPLSSAATPAEASKPTPLAEAKPAPLAAAKPAPLAAAKPAPLPAATPAPAVPDNASTTQKPTLKLTRPGIGIKKPTLGIKKPAPIPAANPSAEQAKPDVADVPEIKDIGDVPPLPTIGQAPVAGKKTSAGVPTWVAVMSFITGFAALLAVGAMSYYFYTEGTCQNGACPLAGDNEMPFIHVN